MCSFRGEILLLIIKANENAYYFQIALALYPGSGRMGNVMIMILIKRIAILARR